MIGTTIGHFEILAKLGTGGMGEVFRARDLRLGRDVAVKMLPDELAADAERLGRFRREAQVVAGLSHPNIATIHGVEEQGGRTYLIFECVIGETLAARLLRGPLPLEAVLDIGVQIASGLEAAHAAGVVHRDLKPGNVMVSPQGRVKILDFGIAKLAPGPQPSQRTQSGTVSYAGTLAGTVLGTPGYMSPEQARGNPVDRRTDIWAFACVLYECLTGKPAFAGDTAADVLAQVLTGEPDWSQLPAGTPVKARNLLRRCLREDPAQRLHDVADARIELEEMLREPQDAAAAPRRLNVRRSWRRRLAWGLAAAALLAAGALASWLVERGRGSPPALRGRFQLQPPAGIELAESDGSATLAVSPDGTWVAYRGVSDATEPRLYLRRIDEVDARPVPRTEGGWNPFFSPDSRWLGFFARGALRKLPLAGGEPIVIYRADRLRGATWVDDDTIVFSAGHGLLRVSADGGEPVKLTTPPAGAGEINHRWPHHVAGRPAVLFQVSRGALEADQEIAVLSLLTGEQRTLVRGGAYPRYADGFLVFARLGTLYAAPFDPERLALRGGPRQALDPVYFRSSHFAAYDLSRTGSCVFTPGTPRVRDSELVQIDREGRVSRLIDRLAPYAGRPAPAPDGRRLAVLIRSGVEEADLWVADLVSKQWTRLTADRRAASTGPVWSPDGRWIVYSAVVGGVYKILRIPADGTGPPEQLSTGEDWDLPNSVAPDGRVVFSRSSVSQLDLLTLALDGDRTPKPLLATPVLESYGAVSPDGRWLAYAAQDSGSWEVYVRPFPGPGPKVSVSTGGGLAPQWSPRGDEILYRCGMSSATAVCAAAVRTGPRFSVGPERHLFELDSRRFDEEFSVSRDGRHLFAIRYPSGETERRIVYAPHWTAELRDD